MIDKLRNFIIYKKLKIFLFKKIKKLINIKIKKHSILYKNNIYFNSPIKAMVACTQGFKLRI